MDPCSSFYRNRRERQTIKNDGVIQDEHHQRGSNIKSSTAAKMGGLATFTRDLFNFFVHCYVRHAVIIIVVLFVWSKSSIMTSCDVPGAVAPESHASKIIICLLRVVLWASLFFLKKWVAHFTVEGVRCRTMHQRTSLCTKYYTAQSNA